MAVALIEATFILVIITNIAAVVWAQVAVVSHVVHFVFVSVVNEPGAVAEKSFYVFTRLSRSLLGVGDIVHFFEF